jgi:hypothetical protein
LSIPADASANEIQPPAQRLRITAFMQVSKHTAFCHFNSPAMPETMVLFSLTLIPIYAKDVQFTDGTWLYGQNAYFSVRKRKLSRTWY